MLLLLEQIKVEKNKNNLYVSLTFRKPQERQTEFGLRRTTFRVWLMKSWRFSFRSMESIQDQLLVSIAVFSQCPGCEGLGCILICLVLYLSIYTSAVWEEASASPGASATGEHPAWTRDHHPRGRHHQSRRKPERQHAFSWRSVQRQRRR